MQIQHGDVTIEKVGGIPDGAQQRVRENGLVILARGEATGHHHAIAGKGATLYELKGQLYLEVTEPVVVTHEEHKALPIPKGVYKIGQVREYDFLAELERRVVD